MMAALEVFDYNGWRFVTIIHEDTPIYTHGLHSFQKAAKQKGICVGQQLKVDEEDLSDGKVDKLIQRLLEAKKQGSSVVVLLTSADSTKRIITGLGRFLEASVLHSGDLVMVGLGEWSERLNVVQGLEKVALGSLIFRPEQGEVSDFATHYSHLLPESNPRNPWYEQLWRQEEMRVQMDKENASSDVPFVEYAPLQSTTNTIQAIIAVAAGIASVRNELCQLDMGLCPVMSQHPQLQQLVGEHIYSSFSPRLDQPGQKFKFTDKGYGELPIEVYNFRKISGKIFNYLKVGTYSGQYTKLANMVTYRPQGEISMDSIMSSCIEDCIRCQYSSTNHVTIPSSQDLYIAVTLGIHEPTSNPLACGPLRTSRGFQNFESLLWAVDVINSNPNILPGVDLGLIVFDTCNSREKVAMDVSNFLTEIMEDKDSLPSPRNVVGFIADGTKDEVRPLLDLTMPLGMSTVAPFVVAPEFGEPRYTHLLRM
ncbi:Metabotropic glutamate receptor 5, partial [Stegodyphus mimosarum]